VAEYAVTFARSARRELEKIDRPMARRILAKIEELSAEPRPAGCQKLRGESGLWRLRVGDYRVVYGVDDSRGLVDIVAVGHRREVYR
jgi:mRNA interferase RelE/StbE